jgi:hypothetical protein
MPKTKQRLTAVQARQGSPRLSNLRVLIGSLTLAVLLGFLFYATLVPPPQSTPAAPQQGELK